MTETTKKMLQLGSCDLPHTFQKSSSKEVVTNYGEGGGYKTERGGGKFYPYKKGGRKSFSHAEGGGGGTASLEVV